MKQRILLCLAVFCIGVTGPASVQRVQAGTLQSVLEESLDSEEPISDEKAKEMLDILNGEIGDDIDAETAEEFLDEMEDAADKVMEVYEEELTEDTFFGGILKWFTDMVERVFDILMDFLNDTAV